MTVPGDEMVDVVKVFIATNSTRSGTTVCIVFDSFHTVEIVVSLVHVLEPIHDSCWAAFCIRYAAIRTIVMEEE